MHNKKFLPLTETTYYILLSLLEPLHGYAVMEKIEELSLGNVRIAAGTLYGALQTLEKKKLIDQVKSEDARRKVYLLTKKGKEILIADRQRMEHMISITKSSIEEIGGSYEKN